MSRFFSPKTEKRLCTIDGCCCIHYGHGYCSLHYQMWKRCGDPLKKKWQRKKRKGYIKDGVGYIPLTQGKFAKVDPEDVERISKHNWSIKEDHKCRTAYARTGDGLIMHRIIMNAPSGKDVDHINHDGLDNRKENMRICDRSLNCFNRRSFRGNSKYKGVSFIARDNIFGSFIRIKGRTYNLGSFKDEEDAAIMYNVVAQFLFGEFAYLNDV